MKAFLFLAILSTVICVSVSASAATLYVDGSVSSSGDGTSWGTALKTIQEGIDKALEGDTVIVAKGTYVENIQFKGKNIVLTGTDTLDPSVVANTIIDGNKLGSVVTFSGTETQACVLSGFTIRNGKAGFGGGICGGTWEARSRAAIQNDIISGNSAWHGGGLAHCDGTIQDNTITGSSLGWNGGGLFDCNGTIQNNTITGNSVQWNGGGLFDCNGTIQDNTITGNSAQWGDGGGLYYCGGTIQNNTITGNSAEYDDGGGLGSCQGTIQNNTITGNTANYGGGLSDCNGTIQNNTISANSAGWGGGLAYCDFVIQNNTITGNSAANGGGLHGCDGTIQNNTISGNFTGWNGGGLFDCNGTIQNNSINGNSAGGGGGLAECEGTIQDNTITGNSAWDGGGGLAHCDFVIQNNTISGNSARWGGGLSWCIGTIRGCVVWGNTAPDGPQLYECSEATYSCIEGWTAGGEGNISEDPRFIDADGPDNDPKTYEDNDYHLAPGSPCVDAGKNEDWMWGAVDIDGEPRIARRETNWVVDMGADEYWQGESLSLDVPRTRPIGTGDRHAYEISTLAGENLLIRVESTDPNAVIRLYASYSFEPGRPGYSYQSDEGQGGAVFLVVPETLEGSCYVLVYGASVSGVSASYTIEAECVDLFLGRVSPSQAGNGGRATLSISGAGLGEASAPRLVGPGGRVLIPVEAIALSSALLCAAFDLTGVEAGFYDLLADDPEGNPAMLRGAFEVTPTSLGARLEARLVAPAAVRPGRSYTVRIEYENSGDADMSPPCLSLWCPQGDALLPGPSASPRPLIVLPAIQAEGRPDVLPPGARGSIEVYMRAPTQAPAIDLVLSASASMGELGGTGESGVRSGRGVALTRADQADGSMGTTVPGRTVMLTFDDVTGKADADGTPKILTLIEAAQEFNREANVACFLNMVDRSPEAINPVLRLKDPDEGISGHLDLPFELVKRGHEIGYHGFSHDTGGLGRDLERAKGDLQDWRDVVDGLLPGQFDKDRLVRFPGWDACQETQDWFEANGYKLVGGYTIGDAFLRYIDLWHSAYGSLYEKEREIYLSVMGDWAVDHALNHLDGRPEEPFTLVLHECFVRPDDVRYILQRLRSDGFELVGFDSANASGYPWYGEDAAVPPKPCLSEGPDPAETADRVTVSIIRPVDPNVKVSLSGTQDQGLVAVSDELQYIVYFENLRAATAPAQEVVVEDHLDPSFDLATFRPTEVAFGNRVIPVSDFGVDFYTRITIPDYRPEVKKEWWVDITIELNYSSRLVTWTFRTLDPETGQLPTDDLAGFLPPNDETGRGEGHVAFAIWPKPDTPPGTVIRNTATIVFDVESPLETNEVWNTVANLAPEAPAWPRPAEGAQDVALHAFLDWASSQRAETYDVYLWKQGEARPIVPTASSLTRSDFQPSPPLEPETLYHWQVSARNISGEAPGPEWTFSTEPVGFRVVGLGWLPNGRLRIEFASLSGHSYSLEGRDSFDSAVWAPRQFYITEDGTAAQTSIQGTGAILRIYAWPAGSRGFYRVATP